MGSAGTRPRWSTRLARSTRGENARAIATDEGEQVKGYGLTAFAARRILLRPMRWLLLGLALAAVTFLTSTTVMLLFAVEATASRVIEAGPALVVSRVNTGGWAAIDERLALRIEQIPGVHAATPRVWGVLPGPPSLTIMADPELATGSALARVGTAVTPAAPGELVVLRGLDGTVRELRIESLLDRNADIVAHDIVFVPKDAALALLLMRPGAATDIAVESARDEENDALVSEIAKTVQVPVRVTTRAQMLGAYRVQTGRTGTVAFVMLVPAILGLILLVGATASGGTTARADVGKLKLMGWSSGDVARLHVTEVGMVSLVAVGLGLSVAYAGLFLFGGSSVAGTVLGWKTELPYLLLSTEGAALSLLVIGASVLVPCLVAALVPAFRLARTDPAELAEAP
jgi:hypothetical protein